MADNPNQMRDDDLEGERDEMRERGAGGTATQADDPATKRRTETGEIDETDIDEVDDTTMDEDDEEEGVDTE